MVALVAGLAVGCLVVVLASLEGHVVEAAFDFIPPGVGGVIVIDDELVGAQAVEIVPGKAAVESPLEFFDIVLRWYGSCRCSLAADCIGRVTVVDGVVEAEGTEASIDVGFRRERRVIKVGDDGVGNFRVTVQSCHGRGSGFRAFASVFDFIFERAALAGQ